ncbi:MAG: DUF2164 family protein [Velocimicrobium sp.]
MDFFKDTLGDRMYNDSLDDAKKFLQKYIEEMETDYYALYREIR